MRKVVLFIASSLDGFIAEKNGGIGWLFSDADYGYKKFFASVDALVMGRKTYELAASFGEWPYGSKKCFVFTRKTGKFHDKRVMFSDSLVELVGKLVKSRGKNIWLVGGGEIVSVLLNAGLVHEIIISIHPIILGSGIPLFSRLINRVKLKVKNQKSFKSGLVQIHYVVQKN